MHSADSDQLKPVKTISRPVLAIGLVVVLTVIAALWWVNRRAFNAIQTEIIHLTQPNQELVHLEQLQFDISRLVQDHRSEAIRDLRKPSQVYEQRLLRVRASLDRLRELFHKQPAQLVRLQQIDSVLTDRTALFERYLASRYLYVHTGQFDRQFQKLATEVENKALRLDSSVVSTSRSTKRYTYYEPGLTPPNEPERKGWFRRKKKNATVTDAPKVLVEEKVAVQVDTLAMVSNKDSLLGEIKSSLELLKTRQEKGRTYLEKLELVLINSNELTLQTVVHIIDDLRQSEELAAQQSRENSIAISSRALFYSRALSFGFVVILLLLVALIAWDFARLKQYRQQLEDAKLLAEAHSHARQRFLATMSHELRTPVQSIIGFSAWLNEQKRYDAEKVQGVYQSAEHLLHVVNDVLDLARIEAGRFSLQPQSFSFDQWLSELDLLFRDRMREKHLKWEVMSEIPPDTWFLADPFRLKQIAINLVGNSLKFTEHGGVKLKVSFDGATTVLEFSDSGIGMDQATLGRLFREFEQAALEHQTLGTGLGLSLVRALVDAFGGSVDVTSAPGKGTTFRIGIPMPTGEKPAEKPTPQTPTSLPVVCWFVDDDPLILSVIDSMLEDVVCERVFFTTPMDVLEHVMPDKPLLIFTDMNMPDMNGAAFLAEVRPKLKASDRVIVLTAQMHGDSFDRWKELGFDAALGKPIQKQTLLDTILAVIPTVSWSFGDGGGFGWDEQEQREFIGSFEEECRKDLGALKSALARRNAEDARLLLHRLAGRMQQFQWGSGAHARVLEREIQQHADEAIWSRVSAWLRDAEAELDLLKWWVLRV